MRRQHRSPASAPLRPGASLQRPTLLSITTNHQRKGNTVTNTGHTSKIPRTATGLFALLGAFLHRQGTSAPKTKGSGLTRALEAVASRMPVRGYTTVSALIVGGLYLGALGLPASASAFATLEGPPVYSSAPGLPDGREYVQASPADKNGNEAGANSNSFDTGAGAHYGLVAPDGNSVLFEGTGPMGESPWAHSELFVATKKEKEAGWSTRALLPRAQQRIAGLTAGIGLLHPSQDLSHALLTAGAMTLAPQRNESCRGQLYLTGPDPFEAGTWLEQTGLEHLIENCSDVPGAPAGGTPNFSTVYFTYPGTLLPEDNERASHAGTGDNVEAWGFYEYTEGVLHEAGVLPNGSLDQFGAVPAASGHGTNHARSSSAPILLPAPARTTARSIRPSSTCMRRARNGACSFPVTPCYPKSPGCLRLPPPEPCRCAIQHTPMSPSMDRTSSHRLTARRRSSRATTR